VTVNRKILLAQRPEQMFSDACFAVVEEPIPEPGDGEAVVRLEYLSLDPAMRGWVRDERSYMPPVQIGDVMRSGSAGRVVSSRSPSLPVGTAVMGMLGWQEYAVVGGSSGMLANPIPDGVDLLDSLSLFGSTGVTAYFGVLDIGQPKAGETFVVSGAAGGVGSIAGQIAKIVGCRVVGIAGTKEKCSWVVDELGFDACIDYKAGDVAEALRDACPRGVDVYFDNVGGEILDAALARLTRYARVVICGAISQYNATGAMTGPSNYMSLLVNHASMTGFVVSDYGDRYAEGISEMAGWLSAGKIVSREDIAQGGVKKFPETLLRLFEGANTGKLVLKVTEED